MGRTGAGALGLCLSAALLALASPVRAHFRLLEPASWIEENALGDPQKAGPCGTAEASPAGATGEVTTFQAGETITVRWQETVAHPGHFRIALAKDRSELADPDIQVDSQCNYAPGSVSEDVEYPVLLDNLFPRTSATAQMFEQEVTLPDMACDKCTLQVIQFMTKHSQPCIYYHCADIRIVGGAASDAGVDAGAMSSGGSGGAGGGMDAGTAAGATGGTMAGATGGTAAAGAGGDTAAVVGGGTVAVASGGASAAAGTSGAAAGATAPPTTGGGDDGGCAVRNQGSHAPSALPWIAIACVFVCLRSRLRTRS